MEVFVEEAQSEALANAFMDAAHSDVPGAVKRHLLAQASGVPQLRKKVLDS